MLRRRYVCFVCSLEFVLSSVGAFLRRVQVYKRVMAPGSLPICRDTPSYVAVMSVLHGGAAGADVV